MSFEIFKLFRILEAKIRFKLLPDQLATPVVFQLGRAQVDVYPLDGFNNYQFLNFDKNWQSAQEQPSLETVYNG